MRVLWDDHAKGTRNESLSFSHVDLNNGRTSSAWYDFNATQNPFISLDAVAGITNMRFAINDKLEGQGGVGFAVQDSVVFSKSSCKFPSTDPFNLTGRFDIAVCAYLCGCVYHES